MTWNVSVLGTLIGVARAHVCRCNPGIRNTKQCSLVCELNILLLQIFMLQNCTGRCHFANKKNSKKFSGQGLYLGRKSLQAQSNTCKTMTEKGHHNIRQQKKSRSDKSPYQHCFFPTSSNFYAYKYVPLFPLENPGYAYALWAHYKSFCCCYCYTLPTKVSLSY